MRRWGVARGCIRRPRRTIGKTGRERIQLHMSTTAHPPAHQAHADGRRTVVKQSYPAPGPLATTTDLSSREAQAVTEALNPLVADLFVLYVKTKVCTSLCAVL